MSVWVAGAGAVSCLGLGKEKLFENLVHHHVGLDQRGLGSVQSSDRKVVEREFQSLSWPVQMGLWAAQEAINEAEWGALTPRDGIIFATTTGQIVVWEQELAHLFQDSENGGSSGFKHYPLGTVVDEFCQYLQLKGPRTLVTSACAASTQALALASLWIETGKVDRCLVGGVEVLCDLTVEGFRSLKLLSLEPCRPFDQARSGINLSEGAAFFCLQREKSKSNSNVKLMGYGLSSDAYHMTSPHPEGLGAYRAMKLALEKAQLSERDIDWVHAHGTGSINNDLAEGAALKMLFKEHKPFISSTKGSHGHTLGISGVFESVICYQGLRHNIQIATEGLKNQDSKIDLEISQAHQQKDISYVLKNTLGFGGVNASLVLGKGS